MNGVQVYVLECMGEFQFNVNGTCEPQCGQYYIQENVSFVCYQCLNQKFDGGICYNTNTGKCGESAITEIKFGVELCYLNATCDYKQKNATTGRINCREKCDEE